MRAPPANLSSPAKRRKLSSGKVHWTTIGGERSGLKLGYRKGAKRGSWVRKLLFRTITETRRCLPRPTMMGTRLAH